MATRGWKSITCSISELRLDTTLVCGQSFRWRETCPGEWTGVLGGQVWTLSQNDQQLFYKVHRRQLPIPTDIKPNPAAINVINTTQEDVPVELITKPRKVKSCKLTETEKRSRLAYTLCNESIKPDTDDASELERSILVDYFQLGVSLENLYQIWSEADSNFRQVARDFRGIRILRQDPVENLFSFICSSNNHITRITSMIEKLCQTYGERVLCLEERSHYSFPQVKALAGDNVEETLRGLRFGYRARYISQTARYIMANYGEDWLRQLRNIPYQECKTELMNLCGVGAKVADCVCLMSLDKAGAIPVDTHVWQIAARDYMPKLKQAKCLTDKLYTEIGDHFRTLWGEYAGWAHSVLFTADLKQFKDRKTGFENIPNLEHNVVKLGGKRKSGNVKCAKEKKVR